MRTVERLGVGFVAAAAMACGGAKQRTTAADAVVQGPSRSDSDEGAAERDAFAAQLTAQLAETDRVTFSAIGAGGRHLTVDLQPACNENTILGMLHLAPTLRERGFLSVTCAPERKVGYLVPSDGSVPTIFDERRGWYCGTDADDIGSSCWRTRDQCLVVHRTCGSRQEPAHCTTAVDLYVCVSTAAECQLHRRFHASSGRGEAPPCTEVL